MLKLISTAKESIDIEQYIFMPDTIGTRFIELLKRKAAAGVKIRVLCDMFGSASLYYSDIPNTLRGLGIEVQFFNPVRLWMIHTFFGHFFRDHRKILIVDGKRACLGGVGIRDDMKTWRDTTIVIEGAFVKNITYAFDLVWKRVKTNKYRRFTRPPVFSKKHEILINSPRFNQRFIYYSLIEHMRQATNRIYLVTPYFVPDNRFVRVLRLAARRGVEVRLIVPEVSNHSLTDFARRSYITDVLNEGGRVFLYGPRMLHAKYASIDGKWATVGSCNFDNLSFRFNHEINFASTDDSFINFLESDFHEDMEGATEVTVEEWNKRPIHWKIREFLARPLHGIL